MPSAASSGKEPFPLLNLDAEPSSAPPPRPAPANGNAARRRKKSADKPADNLGNLTTSLAHLSGIDSSSLNKDASKDKRLSERRKTRSLVRRLRQYAVRHTWALPLALMLLFLAGYAVNPSESNPMSHFIFLSYRISPAAGADPGTPVQYGKGLWDIAFVSFYTVVLSFTREFIMQVLLRPLARYYGLSRTKQARFMEQMYTAIYFGTLGPIGLYVMSHTPLWFYNTRAMYETYPNKTHEAEFKFYYLFQAAYWAQQAIVLVLGLEKRRKDFMELVGHHIVSLSLIGLSYRFHFAYIGIAVYTTHDISDFFLATSKSLNYINGPFMEPYFFLFVCVWIYMRHWLNLRIIYSLFTEFRTVGPYVLDWANGQFKCPIAFVITTSLLSALQALNLFWLFLIFRIAYRLVVLNIAQDDRSDGDDSDVEEPAGKEIGSLEKKPLLDTTPIPVAAKN